MTQELNPTSVGFNFGDRNQGITLRTTSLYILLQNKMLISVDSEHTDGHTASGIPAPSWTPNLAAELLLQAVIRNVHDLVGFKVVTTEASTAAYGRRRSSIGVGVGLPNGDIPKAGAESSQQKTYWLVLLLLMRKCNRYDHISGGGVVIGIEYRR